MSRGNRNVILCERGIRTFETQYRNTLDLAAVPSLKELSHLPVIVDPSHATGKWQLVAPMAKAAVAAGADGLLIEVHSNPECALCDGEESIKPTKFKELMHDLKKIAEAVGREIFFAPRRLCARFCHDACDGFHSRQALAATAQARRLPDEGPLRDGDLRRQGA